MQKLAETIQAEIMGRHGGEIDSTGEHFGDISAFNSLVISSTIFPYKGIHKVARTM